MNSVSTATNGCSERRSTSALRSSDLVISGWIRMSLGRALAAASRLDKKLSRIEARRALSTTFFRLRAHFIMHAYRTHTCGELRASNVGETVRLSGWVHRKRDHGHLLFVDLRDHYGVTQIVVDTDSPAFRTLDRLRVESVVTVEGEVVARSPETVNPNLDTGEIEVRAREVTVQSAAAELPMPVAGEQDYPEDIRLK